MRDNDVNEFRAVAGQAVHVLGDVLAPFAAILFVVAAYFFITLDRQRANSPNKDDTQVGIKLVLYSLIIVAIGLVAGGLGQLLAYILGGAKGGSGPVRAAMPPIIVGAVGIAAIATQLLPRTNSATYKQGERFALGFLGVQYGAGALIALNDVVTGLFTSAGWQPTSGHVATLVVAAAIALVAITRLGKHSGWVAAAPPAPPMQYPPQGQPPMQGGGYGQQGGYGQGGYGQGGGYPPQGGGYPPQGGGGGGYGR
jgi:hypothetical protein